MSYFKFSNYTGRLATSSQASTYMPTGFQAAVNEPTPFHFDSHNTRPVVVPNAANQAAAAEGVAKGIVPIETGYKSVRGLQTKMGIEDGLMVWQKRGAMDKFPAWATFGLMTVATVYGLSLIVKMSFPPKNQ